MTQDLVILKLHCAKQALVEAKTIQQTKQIVDIAVAAEIYAKRQQLSEESIRYAHAIKIEALRRLGTMLKETPDAKTGPKPKQLGSHMEPNSIPTLADLGINKKTSMTAQRLAELPPDKFKQVEGGTATLAMIRKESRCGANTKKAPWSLESVDHGMRKAINALISDAPPGSQRDISDLLRNLADELDDAARPELQEAVLIAREDLEIHDAEPGGFLVFETAEEASTHAGGPRVIRGFKSTHQHWYRDLTTYKPGVAALRRKQVEARLTDIEIGRLPTAQTAQTHFAVVWAIQGLSRTSAYGREAPQ